MLTRIFRGRDWSSPGFRTIRPVLRPLLFRGWTRDAPNPKTRVYPCRRRDRPDRARLALGCLSSRFVLPCLKRSTTPPPRRGTRRGGPLPTAPARAQVTIDKSGRVCSQSNCQWRSNGQADQRSLNLSAPSLCPLCEGKKRAPCGIVTCGACAPHACHFPPPRELAVAKASRALRTFGKVVIEIQSNP